MAAHLNPCMNSVKLKFIIPTILIAFLCSFDCSGQLSSPVKYGSKKAFNYATICVKDAEHSKAITGFAVGFFAKLALNRNFSLQPEIYYTTKGSQVTYENPPLTGVAEFHLHYFEMPVFLVFNISDYFNLHAGPFISVLLNSSVKNISTENSFDFEQNAELQDYRLIETGVAAGTGTDIGIFSFGLRYNYSVTKIARDETLISGEFLIPDGNNIVVNIYLNIAVSELKRIYQYNQNNLTK